MSPGRQDLDDVLRAPALVAVGWTDDELAAGTIEGEGVVRDGVSPPMFVRQPHGQAEGLRLGAPPPAALLVTKAVAADMLSMSVDSLEKHVIGDLRTVRVGGMVRIPMRELEQWVGKSAARALASER